MKGNKIMPKYAQHLLYAKHSLDSNANLKNALKVLRIKDIHELNKSIVDEAKNWVQYPTYTC